MPVYATADELYTVLKDVFDRVNEEPAHITTFTSSNLVIRMRFTGPEAEVLLDGRQPPLEVFFGNRPGDADLELSMAADLLHKIWLGQVKLKDAFFGGQIQTKGNVLRAMKLTDLFREAETAYPQVLAQQGRM
ncbi:MAG: SCP2 sterol-binding domain-containing protein [Caldilineaceae bacterium]|nr:SCP2 sterol-binding domain-containing protein [Caldilineaceae bacterium]